MVERAALKLRGRNPDVLTCIANLSSDEVFTPPGLAAEMLDTLAAAWADAHGGASIWADKSVTFLDPVAKSGVFLREITSRLTAGLATEIPDLRDRVDHILTKQVYGMAITKLTSLMARRSVYCSKSALSPHSIADSFTDDAGNVWFESLEHTWTGSDGTGRCKYCGASPNAFDRGPGLETHAYAFVHTDDIAARMSELFGANMQFDVIIGNPPYQIDDEGGHRPVPLYNKFVTQAKELNPRFLVMVTPSRWMAGGLGLAGFRSEMLTDSRLRALVDYPVSSEVFAGVEIKGGISYFLWDRDEPGPCRFTTVREGMPSVTVERSLGDYDILVRDSVGVPILERVLAADHPSFESLVASVRPFGDKLRSNFKDYKDKKGGGYSTPLLVNESGTRKEVWTRAEYVTANHELAAAWKVFLPKAGSDGGQRLPNPVIGVPRLGRPGQVSTETYLAIGPFSTEKEAKAAFTYLTTRFARYMISLRKVSQDNVPSTFKWLPVPDWSDTLTDGALARAYGLTDAEVAHIELMVSTWDGAGD